MHTWKIETSCSEVQKASDEIGFPVNNTISYNDLVASWFRTKTIKNCWVSMLACGILLHHMLTYIIKIMGR